MVIVDEAHSSQTGEAAKDLKAALDSGAFPRLWATYIDLTPVRRNWEGQAILRSYRQGVALLRMAELYQQRFAGPDGRIPASFQVIYLTGWAPSEVQQKPLRPGSAKASDVTAAVATRARELEMSATAWDGEEYAVVAVVIPEPADLR